MALARLACSLSQAYRCPAQISRAYHAPAQGSLRAWLDAGPRTSHATATVQGLHGPRPHLGALGWGLRGITTAEKAGNAIRNAAAATGAAAKGVAGALAKVPSTAYGLLPAQARSLAEATSKPGVVQRVVSLQLNSFWQQHGNKVYAVGGIFLAYCLWRTMYGVASTFINLSETMAAGGFLVRPGWVWTWCREHGWIQRHGSCGMPTSGMDVGEGCKTEA